MLRSWKLGTAFGIGIHVHWSFILLPLFVLWSSGASLAGSLVLMLLLAAVIGCVVLHELGHALTARRYGIQTRDITLTPLGGIANLERMSENPWEELWITVAGPAVNVVIAILLGGMLIFTSMLAPLDNRPMSLGEEFILHLMAFNVLMVVFNLIPAFPMDGGRIFRALLSFRQGRLRATEIAANCSVLFAGLFVLAGLGLFGGVHWLFPDRIQPFLIMIGLFVVALGQAELLGVRRQEEERELRRRGLWPVARPGEILPGAADPTIVMQPHIIMPAELPRHAEADFSGFTWDAGRRAWIEWRNGRPTHICWME